MRKGERDRRLGLNEALFREVNERVKGINEEFGERLSEAQFICECGDETCTARVRMPLGEYERVRAEATLFVVCPGHEIPDVETVVEEHDDYTIVRKRAGDAERLAKQTNPRD